MSATAIEPAAGYMIIDLSLEEAPGILAELEKASFEPGDQIKQREWAKLLHFSVFYACAAKVGDVIAGAAVVVVAAGIGYLYSYAVIPEWQRRGIGSRLLKQATEVCKDKGKCVKIQAHTRTHNLPSQTLLIKAGFVAVQYVTDYYADFEDGVLWEKAL